MSNFVDQGQKYNQKGEQFESSKMDLNINLIFSDNLYPFLSVYGAAVGAFQSRLYRTKPD